MMPRSTISVGLQIGTQPPLGATRAVARYAKLAGLRSLMTIDHFQNIFPTAVWDEDFSWLATQRSTPHEHFDYQAVLGHLAGLAGNLQLGVGVTDATRRHPVVIAQTMLTLAHMTRRAPILGIGAGERMNIEPYGLDFSHPVGRLAEALQIIRMCFSQAGHLDFKGHHYSLDGALMELKAPPGKTPLIWVAGHGTRMLELVATYGDGWYPTMLATPQEYATKLDAIQTSARIAGRDPRDILPALHRFLVVAPTERDARAQLEHKAIRALGLASPAEQWAKIGAQHPFGPNFRGYVDIVPDRYDRRTITEAIAAVPSELIENGPLLWGSPEQVADRLREFGDAGLRHVVLAPISGLVSKSAMLYSLWATRTIAHSLAHAA